MFEAVLKLTGLFKRFVVLFRVFYEKFRVLRLILASIARESAGLSDNTGFLLCTVFI
jgi:hypothetical protein